MELISLILCDSANVLADGRFNLLGGGVDQVRANQYPASGHLTVVVRIEVSPTEVGLHRLNLRFVNADGREVIPPINAELNVDSGVRFVNLVLGLQDFVYPAPGLYSIRIVLDNQDVGGAPIEAILTEG